MVLASANSAEAVQLALYDFTAAGGTQLQTPATSVASNLSAGPVSRGAGLTATAGANSINSTGWTTGGILIAVAGNDYYGFSITPNAGYEIDFTELRFSEARSITGIRNIEVRASLDNFATFTTLSTIAVPDNNSTRTQTIDLTAFNILENQLSTVDFRLYGYTAEATTGSWRLNSPTVGSGLIVSGEISPIVPASTPEPSSLVGFITLGGLILSRTFRKAIK